MSSSKSVYDDQHIARQTYRPGQYKQAAPASVAQIDAASIFEQRRQACGANADAMAAVGAVPPTSIGQIDAGSIYEQRCNAMQALSGPSLRPQRSI